MNPITTQPNNQKPTGNLYMNPDGTTSLTKPVSNNYSATDIGSNNGAFQTPSTTPSTNFLDELKLTTGNTFNNAQTDVTNAENERNKSVSEISNLFGQLTGQTTDQIKAEEAAGLPNLNANLRDLQALSQKQLASYIQNVSNNDINATGMTRAGQSATEAQIQRQHGIDAMITNANIAAINGQIQTAKATVDRAISLKYEPIKTLIQSKLQILELNKDNLSRADKKLADAQTVKLNLQMKELEDKQQKDTLVQNMLMEASAMKAPASVLKTANDLVKNGGTPAQVAQALGQYTGASAKAELLDAQIKTEKAKALNEKVPTIKTINGIDMQWDTKSKTWIPVTTGGTVANKEQATKTLDNLKFLLDTTKTAEDLSGASGRSGARKFLEGTFVGATDYTNLEAATNTLRTNVLTLMTDPSIKKFFGPQMSEADVRLMTAAGTTLNPEIQSPDALKTEVTRLKDLLTRMKNSVIDNTQEGKYVNNIVGNSLNSTNTMSVDDYANSLITK